MVAIGWLFDVGPMLTERWSIVAIFTDKRWLLVGYSTLGQCWLNVGPIVSIITDKCWLLVGYSTLGQCWLNVGLLSHLFLINVGFWLDIRRWANVGSLSPFSLINVGFWLAIRRWANVG